MFICSCIYVRHYFRGWSNVSHMRGSVFQFFTPNKIMIRANQQSRFVISSQLLQANNGSFPCSKWPWPTSALYDNVHLHDQGDFSFNIQVRVLNSWKKYFAPFEYSSLPYLMSKLHLHLKTSLKTILISFMSKNLNI